MRTTSPIVVALAIGVAAIAGIAAPASGAGNLKPKSGDYNGTEADSNGGIPIFFSVTKHRTFKEFGATAETKPGCKRKSAVHGFEVFAPKKISASGHFKMSSDFYTGHPTVTVQGRFVSPTKVKGRFTVHFKQSKGCNATHSFTAKHK